MPSANPTIQTSKTDEALRLFRKRDMLRMADALRAGIHRRTLYDLRDKGLIEAMSRGLYRLADAPPLADPDLVTVALRAPKGIVCLISALAFHEMTTQIPHEVSLAIPRNSVAPRIVYPPVRVFRLSPEPFEAGVETHIIDGIAVHIYSREKTLADCFKFRNTVGLDTALEAVRLYKQQGRVNVAAIMRFARICRVGRVMRPYLEALL